MVPPAHHEIGCLGNLGPSLLERIHVPVAQRLAHAFGTDERGISYDEIRLRPSGLPRVYVTLHRVARAFVGNLPPGHWRRLHRRPIPGGNRRAVIVSDPLHTIVSQYCIPVLDVPEVSDHRLRRMYVSTRPEMPLQVADPQHNLRNRRCARIELDSQQVVWIHCLAGGGVSALPAEGKAGLTIAEFI